MPCKNNQDLMYYSNYDYCTLLFHCCSNCYPKGLTQVLIKIIQQCDSQKHLIRVCNYGFRTLNHVTTKKSSMVTMKKKEKLSNKGNWKSNDSCATATSFSNFTKVLQGLCKHINCGIIEPKSDAFNFLQCAWILIMVGCDVDYPAISKSISKTKKTAKNSKNKSEKQNDFCHLLDIVYKFSNILTLFYFSFLFFSFLFVYCIVGEFWHFCL